MTDPIDVTELLVELSRGLDQAFEPAVQSDAYKREQLAAALMVVARFLAKTIGRAPASEIFDLGSAIANLNSGAVHPLLGPPTDIPRRDPSPTWRARVNAVLAVDALHVTGSPLPFAARDVLRMIKRHNGREPGMSVEMLLNWRKEVSAGRIKNAEARELLDVGRELIQARRSDTRVLRQIAVRRAEAAGKADGVFAPLPIHRGLGEEGWTAEHEMMLPPDLQLNQDDDAKPMSRLASGTVVVRYADAPKLPPGPARPQGVAIMAWSVARR